ncbi:uncharacterized protein LOC126992988 isoform X2 [Eriocheir sinensis]|uniref:uncharacterized protein LOC126992988 isoform X2 n=1 Tax=Eriocheir sinensis TaxID=95602 RepID=UPI0021C7E569|nr:uncharacterized protein LOC126992988 isoform X2 [Eriocheir sinensis]
MAGRRAALPLASRLLLVLVMTRPVLACWPDYVEQGAEQADVVVMAKVIHVGSTRGHGLNSFYNLVRIQVKTFLKGEETCRKHVQRPEWEEEATFVEVPDPPSSPPTDPPLGVDGVSARGTCSGRVRVGDIMIFFLRPKTQTEVREGRSAAATFLVTSQPIKLNLQLLRYTQTAVQGKPDSRRRIRLKLHPGAPEEALLTGAQAAVDSQQQQQQQQQLRQVTQGTIKKHDPRC